MVPEKDVHRRACRDFRLPLCRPGGYDWPSVPLTQPRAAMVHLPYLFELSPLYLAQAALTIWMLVDANRRGVDFYWFWVILVFQPFGPWAYFFLYKLKDLQRGSS